MNFVKIWTSNAYKYIYIIIMPIVYLYNSTYIVNIIEPLVGLTTYGEIK